MEIDLSLLHSNTVSEIDISGSYDIPYDYYKNSNIIKLDKIIVDGVVKLYDVSCDVSKCGIICIMMILLVKLQKKVKIHLIFFNFYGKILY